MLQSRCPRPPFLSILPRRSWSCLQLQLHKCYGNVSHHLHINSRDHHSVIIIIDFFFVMFRSRSSEMRWRSIVQIGAASDRPKGLKRRSLWRLQLTKNSTLVTHRGLYQLRKKKLPSSLQNQVFLFLIHR